ncbi:MAG: outer membrane protein assembly factor BamA [Rubellimicrobium sp.]|nr:outer membrane protein assembly factor BamA [Rubellimicrobium sp.]
MTAKTALWNLAGATPAALRRFGGSFPGLARRSSLRLGLIAVAFGVALSAGPGALAQTFQFNQVVVEGNQRIETQSILAFAGIARGQSLTAGELNAAARNIRASGQFESVEVIPQGSTLVIQVVEFPTISRINFEGNRRLSNAQLSAVIGSLERRVYSPAQAEADVAAIAAAYAADGRINAVVTPAIIRRPDNRVDLVFEIFEGGETEIERVSFVGNRSFSDGRLRNVLGTKQAGLLRSIIASDRFDPDRIAFDERVLTDFYRSRGFADFRVRNVDVALTRERDAYLITFNVEEGPRFTFGNITVTSEIPEADAAAFQQALRLRPGVTYSPVLIEQDVARLERLALQQGIRFLRVDPRITRNERDLQLNVEFALVRGDRIFVERIDIEGNATTLDRVIRNQFRTVEGDPFNPRAIRESAERIRALGFFADAQVNARPGSAEDQVVIDVNVAEAPTGSLSFGANFSTDSGLAFLASFSERNFLGRGQSLRFQIVAGADNQVYSFNFAEPQFLGRDLRFALGLDYRLTDNQNAVYDTEVFRFSPSFTFPVSEFGNLAVFYVLNYSDITDVRGLDTPEAEDDPSIVIIEEAALSGIWTNAVGYTYSYDTRRRGLDPNAGVLLRFGQEFGVGDASFIRTTATASAETRVLNEEVLLRATLEGGHLVYQEGFSRVTDRFFMGSRVMRGFEPGGIGPRDADTGDALGGNTFAVARLEAEFPLGLPEEYGISGGVFVDYGSVWDIGRATSADVLYNDFTPRAVAGVSIFWDTPIGPLRFNFTEALMAEELDRPRSFDFTVSTSF